MIRHVDPVLELGDPAVRELGHWLGSLARAQGLSRTDLAAQLGCSRKTLDRFMRGTRATLQAPLLFELCALLNVQTTFEFEPPDRTPLSYPWGELWANVRRDNGPLFGGSKRWDCSVSMGVIRACEARMGRPCVLDAFANRTNTRAPAHIDAETDARAVRWRDFADPGRGWAWANPPFGRSWGTYLDAVFSAVSDGWTVLVYSPNNSDTEWAVRLIERAAELWPMVGRVRHLLPSGPRKQAARFPSLVTRLDSGGAGARVVPLHRPAELHPGWLTDEDLNLDLFADPMDPKAEID